MEAASCSGVQAGQLQRSRRQHLRGTSTSPPPTVRRQEPATRWQRPAEFPEQSQPADECSPDHRDSGDHQGCCAHLAPQAACAHSLWRQQRRQHQRRSRTAWLLAWRRGRSPAHRTVAALAWLVALHVLLCRTQAQPPPPTSLPSPPALECLQYQQVRWAVALRARGAGACRCSGNQASLLLMHAVAPRCVRPVPPLPPAHPAVEPLPWLGVRRPPTSTRRAARCSTRPPAPSWPTARTATTAWSSRRSS